MDVMRPIEKIPNSMNANAENGSINMELKCANQIMICETSHHKDTDSKSSYKRVSYNSRHIEDSFNVPSKRSAVSKQSKLTSDIPTLPGMSNANSIENKRNLNLMESVSTSPGVDMSSLPGCQVNSSVIQPISQSLIQSALPFDRSYYDKLANQDAASYQHSTTTSGQNDPSLYTCYSSVLNTVNPLHMSGGTVVLLTSSPFVYAPNSVCEFN